jgi:hypothetical protein
MMEDESAYKQSGKAQRDAAAELAGATAAETGRKTDWASKHGMDPATFKSAMGDATHEITTGLAGILFSTATPEEQSRMWRTAIGRHFGGVSVTSADLDKLATGTSPQTGDEATTAQPAAASVTSASADDELLALWNHLASGKTSIEKLGMTENEYIQFLTQVAAAKKRRAVAPAAGGQ